MNVTRELSSNWKKLQAKIKAESSPATASSSPSISKPRAKRKAEASTAPPHPKRQKPDKPTGETQGQSKKSKPPQHSSKPTVAPKAQMGVTQSSAVTRGTSATITPSLALWAEDNDISHEDLAEAYNLGAKNHTSLPSLPASAAKAQQQSQEDKARANEGLAPPDVVESLGRYVALDCEMVGVGPEGRDSALARVSLVDFHGRQVYDSFVRPRELVTDWRTAITGLALRHMRNAREFADVQREVAALVAGRVIVGHDIRHDLAALELGHPSPQVRDTARFSGYRKYGHGPKPALRVLAREVLGVEIQTGHHSSLQDARVAMLLFRKKKPEFDVEHASKYGRIAGEDGKDKAGPKPKPQGKKKKKRHR
ncbi:hypothetical protein DL766_008314 [Monosporascus sp. MC13-8B]|nr:hypothetical protein DL763_008248 [Monosporascus cannonballus]RYP19960.1 hypothetical protein DL766_008314 [Monosporascus sp. MC13-8B]